MDLVAKWQRYYLFRVSVFQDDWSVSPGTLGHGGRARAPHQGSGASQPGVPGWVCLEGVAGLCILAGPMLRRQVGPTLVKGIARWLSNRAILERAVRQS